MKQRNIAIDAIKGLAILAVVLYHFGGGYLPYGYLGVDVFFVVGGYLLSNSLNRQITKKEFRYWQFLIRKIVRLWPLVVLASVVAVGFGYFMMLPDDYENLAQSAIASSAFANNILQCITTKNYWDIVNLYKPLMHLWYVGVLMQAYVVIPLVFVALEKVFGKRWMIYGTCGLTLLSLILFLIPTFTSAWKFYYLPFRIFEICCGGLLCIWKFNANDKVKKATAIISTCTVFFLFCSRTALVSGNLMLILATLSTLAFIWSTEGERFTGIEEKLVLAGAAVGRRSYSIYIWHQVIVAFMFYSLFSKQNVVSLVVFVGCTALISLLSYQFIEIPLGRGIGSKGKVTMIIISTIIVGTTLCSVSFLIYRNAGVIRDVPELNVYIDKVHRGMNSEYCDRPYAWNNDFADNGKVKTLVIGNSFGRDWANVLREWDSGDKLDISYIYFSGSYSDEDLMQYQSRIQAADFVFCSKIEGLILIDSIPREKLYVVGNKNYGGSNGIIYSHRHSDNYFNQTIEISRDLLETNEEDSAVFGSHYIDMMTPVMADEGHVRVFTDDNKFISQDCRHLTQAGAQYYARILDIGAILGIN